MDFFTVLLILLIATIVYRIIGKKNYPPGPTPYPFIGSSRLVKKLCRKYNGLHHAMRELSKQYNTNVLSVTLGWTNHVIVQSEPLVNHVLLNDEFQARPDTFFLRLRSMGKRNGITMTDGEQWAEQRMFAVKQLHELGLGRQRMNDLIQTQLQDLFSALERSEISSLSFRKLLSKCVLNVLWEIVTGESFKHKEQQLNDLIAYMEERAKVFDMSGGVLSWFPFIRHICPEYSGYNLIVNMNKKFKNMIMAEINEHKRTYNKDVTRDYIDAFFHEMYKNSEKNNATGSSFTIDQLIMVCLDLFIAGSQTTSSSLDFLCFYMVHNPNIQEKVQNELDSILQPGDIPSIRDRLKCPYTEGVISESQRMSPVAPVIGPRRVTRDTYIDGYFIPKGTVVLLNLYASNMDPEKWESPEVMMPERHIGEDGKISTEQRLFSFGKGKRRCPGEVLARNFTFIFFAGLIHNYKLQLSEEKTSSIKTVSGITQSPSEYSIKLSKRFST